MQPQASAGKTVLPGWMPLPIAFGTLILTLDSEMLRGDRAALCVALFIGATIGPPDAALSWATYF
jgi:hypothetical protein